MVELARNPSQLLFFRLALQKRWEDMMQDLGRAMGTLWDPHSVHLYNGTLHRGPKDAKKQREAFSRPFWVPLSVLLAPNNFLKQLAALVPHPDGKGLPPVIAGGTYVPGPKDGEVVSMGDASKEAFFSFLGSAGLLPPGHHMASQIPGEAQGDSEAAGEAERVNTPITEDDKEGFTTRLREAGLFRPPGWSGPAVPSMGREDDD